MREVARARVKAAVIVSISQPVDEGDQKAPPIVDQELQRLLAKARRDILDVAGIPAHRLGQDRLIFDRRPESPYRRRIRERNAHDIYKGRGLINCRNCRWWDAPEDWMGDLKVRRQCLEPWSRKHGYYDPGFFHDGACTQFLPRMCHGYRG